MTFKRFTNKENEQLVTFAKRALHGLDESRCFIGMLDDDELTPARIEFTLQIGHAILTDKPIVITVPQGAKIPAKLRAVADQIVVYNPDDLSSLEYGVARSLTELGIKKS
jgi:hypothetical protein